MLPPRPGLLARLRPVAAPWLLALFVSTAQVVPALHLATHRPDHTHGPEGDHGHRDAGPHDDHDDGADDVADPRAAAFAGHAVTRRPSPPAHVAAGAGHRHDGGGARPVAADRDHVGAHHHTGDGHHRTAHDTAAAGEREPDAAVPATSGHGHDDGGAPADHGRTSSAHFALALIDGPAPLFLPPPPETLAPAPDEAARTCHSTPLAQPPARGPPLTA